MPNKQIQSLTVEGVTYDIVDNTSGYINAQYIENKTDYSIPVSRAGEIVVGETAIGTDSTNFPTSKAVVDYVDERVVQEIEAIDIPTVPTKTSDLTNDSGYLTISDIASVMTYKGTKANYAALPSTGNTTGDVWHLTDTGAEWAWDGSQWQELGTSVDLSGYVPTSRKINGNALTSDITLNIPSKTSDLLNDSGFITSASLPTEVYWADYGSTTSAQIETAYQAGKVVCVKYNNFIYTLSYRVSAVMHIFGSDIPETHYSLNCDNNVWSASTTYYPPLNVNEKIIDHYLPDYHDIFWATYDTTTNAEIDTAINAGKIPVVAVGGRALPLRYATTSFHRFACVDNGTEYTVTCASNTWGVSTQSFVPVGSNGKIAASYLPIYNGGVS